MVAPAPVRWSGSYGGSGWDEFAALANTPDGHIIAVGTTTSPDGDFPAQPGKTGARLYSAVAASFTSDGKLVWARAYGGSKADGFTGVAVNPDGSIIVVGYTGSPDGDFPKTTNDQLGLAGQSDAVIAGLTPNGDLIWAKTYGGTRNDQFSAVAVGGDGSIALVGSTSSLDGSFPRPPLSGYNTGIIAKATPTGNITWAHTYASNDTLTGVAVAPDGSVIAVGSTASQLGGFQSQDTPEMAGSNPIAAEFTTDGTLIWSKAYGRQPGSTVSEFDSVTADTSGNIIAVGYSGATNGDFAVTHGVASADALVAKLNPNGALIWHQMIGGSGWDQFNSVTTTPDGDIIAAGYTTSNDGDFPTTDTSRGGAIAKVSSSGDLSWAKRLDGTSGETLLAIATLPTGGMAVAGHAYPSQPDINKTPNQAVPWHAVITVLS